MSTCEIHAIFLKNGDTTGFINLSHRYAIELGSDQALFVRLNHQVDSLLREDSVASFTALFGENGCGKTDQMLKICRTFSPHRRGQRLGVLYSIGKTCYLHHGESLAGWSINPNSVELEPAKEAPQLASIFYSSSPFENSRLDTNLDTPGVINISPKFSEGLHFDGLALCQNLDHIVDKPPFLVDAMIDVRGWVSQEEEGATLVEELVAQYGYNERAETRQVVLANVHAWFEAMTKEESVITLANLLIIRSLWRKGARMENFVGQLFSLVTDFIPANFGRPHQAFVELCQARVRANKGVSISGQEVLAFIRAMARAVGETHNGYQFKRPVTIQALAVALKETDPKDEIARFVVNHGFMEFKACTLSSGEFAFLFLFAAIGSALRKIEGVKARSPVFLLIDEGEMFLHPYWQGSYIRKLLNYVAKCNRKRWKIHLVISTHSLIVAADAPPNTLFDIARMQANNGFALGPKAVLNDVYHIPNFAGTNTAEKIDKVVSYLREPRARANKELRQIVAALADVDLKAYVEGVMRTRGDTIHA